MPISGCDLPDCYLIKIVTKKHEKLIVLLSGIRGIPAFPNFNYNQNCSRKNWTISRYYSWTFVRQLERTILQNTFPAPSVLLKPKMGLGQLHVMPPSFSVQSTSPLFCNGFSVWIGLPTNLRLLVFSLSMHFGILPSFICSICTVVFWIWWEWTLPRCQRRGISW